MAKKNYIFVEGYRREDWVCYCAICGNKTWASDITKLANETGRGGLLVCPMCVDSIDYGLIPYYIEAEKAVPFINNLLVDPVIDTDVSLIGLYETFDPAAGYTTEDFQTWDKLVLQQWNLWTTTPWGTL